MSFAMTHLAIANNLMMRTNRIKCAADFYLGSVAPDFIHIRANYSSEMKKQSHLCVGDEAWGRITNKRSLVRKCTGFS